jgi:HNH endonuclease
MVTHSNNRVCVYCGGAVHKVRKGEHIIPVALGGKRTISDSCKDRTVCNPCNNGPLSQLDTELCSRSPLSIVAARELDAFVWQTWDVDHGGSNVSVRPTA